MEYLLTLTCPEGVGIVHAVAGFLVEHGCNILDNRQYSDKDRGRLFMRVHVEGPVLDPDKLSTVAYFPLPLRTVL